MASAGTARLGVDVGGTFTDLVLEVDGTTRIAKVASTPADQSEGVLDGIGRLGLDPGDLGRFVHGTTVATNTVLERDGARVTLVTTRGFKDLLEIGRQDRPSLYDLGADRPAPLVRGDDVIEVAERLTAEGEVHLGLTREEIERVVAAVADREPEAVAISLLFSFLDDRHERALADALRDRLGDTVAISRSSDVLPVFREYERTSTTGLNAYVAPRVSRYLDGLEARLASAGYGRGVEVMRSGGGTFAAGVGARYPVHTLLSGPAAGVWGAAAVASTAGFDDVISFDMGGTSSDVSLIVGGRPQTTASGAVGGLPSAVTTTDVHTVGSGGGSIAWADAGGALRVGPRSAGAVPGPACYGRGGTEPTVTDANVLLGRLAGDAQLGGHLGIRPDLARAALSDLAGALGLDLVETARGVLAVVEAQMAKALRVVSVERGHDPRRFTLVPFGGAGPLHQAALARELGCARVLVPRHPGVLSALGLLAAPITVDEVRTTMVPSGRADPQDLERVWRELEAGARELVVAQGVEVADLRRSADLRYRGQAFELQVAAATSGVEPDVDALVAAFHDRHVEAYGYRMEGEEVEIVNLRVRAQGPQPTPPLATVDPGRGAEAARTGTTTLVLDDRAVDCPVYDQDRLGAGDRVAGPAIVAGIDATCLVAGWQTGEVDEIGNLVLVDRDQQGAGA